MKNLMKIREERKMTQTEIAKKLNVARNTVSQWENLKRSPNCEMLIKLSNLLKVSIDELLGNDNQVNNLSVPKDKQEIVNFIVDNNITQEHFELLKMTTRLNNVNLMQATCYTAGLLTGQN